MSGAGPLRRAADLRAVQGHLRPQARRGAAGHSRALEPDRPARGHRADGQDLGPAHRAGQLDRQPRQPLDGARLRQSRLEPVLRQGHRRDGRQLRARRAEADESRAAGLPRGRLRQARLEREEAAARDPAVEHLSAIVAGTRRRTQGRPGQQAAVRCSRASAWRPRRSATRCSRPRASWKTRSAARRCSRRCRPARTAPNRNFWITSDNPHEVNRRSVYVFIRRNLPYPLLDTFDWANPQIVHNKRDVTTTAPQALALINSDLVYSWSKALAGRVIQETQGRGRGAHRPRLRDPVLAQARRVREGPPAEIPDQRGSGAGQADRRGQEGQPAGRLRRHTDAHERRSTSSTKPPMAAPRTASSRPRWSSSSTSRSRRSSAGRPRRTRTTTRRRSPPRRPPPTPPPTRRRPPTTAPPAATTRRRATRRPRTPLPSSTSCTRWPTPTTSSTASDLRTQRFTEISP
jgi:hypothetical protein